MTAGYGQSEPERCKCTIMVNPTVDGRRRRELVKRRAARARFSGGLVDEGG